MTHRRDALLFDFFFRGEPNIKSVSCVNSIWILFLLAYIVSIRLSVRLQFMLAFDSLPDGCGCGHCCCPHYCCHLDCCPFASGRHRWTSSWRLCVSCSCCLNLVAECRRMYLFWRWPYFSACVFCWKEYLGIFLIKFKKYLRNFVKNIIFIDSIAGEETQRTIYIYLKCSLCVFQSPE